MHSVNMTVKWIELDTVYTQFMLNNTLFKLKTKSYDNLRY